MQIDVREVEDRLNLRSVQGATPISSKCFYKAQEYLAKNHLDKFVSSRVGGVNATSGLPPELNKFASVITVCFLVNRPEEELEELYEYYCNKYEVDQPITKIYIYAEAVREYIDTYQTLEELIL